MQKVTFRLRLKKKTGKMAGVVVHGSPLFG